MVFNELTKKMWSVTVSSDYILSNKNKELITDLIDAECHNTIEKYKFILHDIIEENNFSEAIIEGNNLVIVNLLSVLKTNLPYRISYKKI